MHKIHIEEDNIISDDNERQQLYLTIFILTIFILDQSTFGSMTDLFRCYAWTHPSGCQERNTNKQCVLIL